MRYEDVWQLSCVKMYTSGLAGALVEQRERSTIFIPSGFHLRTALRSSQIPSLRRDGRGVLKAESQLGSVFLHGVYQVDFDPGWSAFGQTVASISPCSAIQQAPITRHSHLIHTANRKGHMIIIIFQKHVDMWRSVLASCCYQLPCLKNRLYKCSIFLFVYGDRLREKQSSFSWITSQKYLRSLLFSYNTLKLLIFV